MRLKALTLGASSDQRALAVRFNACYELGVRYCRQVVRDAGVDCYIRVHRDCPVDTGFMRDHIALVFTRDGLAWQIGWDETEFFEEGLPFYPIFVIFGTRFMAARDVLFPNVEQTNREFAPAIEGAMAAAVDGANKLRRRSRVA